MRCNYNVKNTNYTVFRTEFYILSSELSGMKHLKIFLDTTLDKTVEIVPSIF